MAADLIRRQVAVIATPGSTDAALAAKSATTTIPIVFGAGGDPVDLGLVASLNRPGGNVTGVTSMNADIAAKRLGLIRELAPQAVRYFALVNPTSVLADPFIKDLQAGAASVGLHVEILHASADAEIDAAFAKLAQLPGAVLLVSTDAFFFQPPHTNRQAGAVDDATPILLLWIDCSELACASGRSTVFLQESFQVSPLSTLMPSVAQSSSPAALGLIIHGRGRIDNHSDWVSAFLAAKPEQFGHTSGRLFCLFGSPQLNVELEHGSQIVVEREPAS
jgi:hypothetical protein